MSTVTKDASSCSDDDVKLRRGPWTVEENRLLIDYIASHGEGRWNLLAKRSGLRRTGKSCRLRWLNYLKPDVKRGNLTPQEQLLILELHSNMGNRWSKIAQHLPGRTDNEIKNYWRTRVEKQARNLKINSKSAAFGEVIRCLWMPRLLQKVHGSSHSLHLSSQYSAKTQPPNEESLSPTQVHTQVPRHTSSLACSLDDHQKNCSSPSIDSCSDDQSMLISPVPQISEYPTNPFQAVGNNDHYNTLLEEGYNVDNISFDMESFSLTATSALGDFRDPITDLHIVENNWIDDNMADSLWNMDELWKFRQL